MSKQTSALIDSAVALALVTALLYCVSTAYYGGYFWTLKLDENVLERNFQYSLYHGFVISFVLQFKVLWLYTIGYCVYSYGLFPVCNDWLHRSWENKRQFIKLKRWWNKRKDSEIERYRKKHARTTFFYAVVFTMLLFLLRDFEKEGKEKAIDVLKKIESNATQQSDLITVKIDDKPKQLFSLMCGARNCAGIDPRTKVVYYFPQNVHSYQLGVSNTK